MRGCLREVYVRDVPLPQSSLTCTTRQFLRQAEEARRERSSDPRVGWKWLPVDRSRVERFGRRGQRMLECENDVCSVC